MKSFNCTKKISYYFPCPQIIWDDCKEDVQIDLCPMSGAVAAPCDIWSCVKIKKPTSKTNNMDYLMIIGIVVAVLFLLVLIGLLVWKLRKNRRQLNSGTPTSVRYRPLEGYRQRLISQYPEYVLPEYLDVNISTIEISQNQLNQNENQ
jgi:hypothetical protein